MSLPPLTFSDIIASRTLEFVASDGTTTPVVIEIARPVQHDERAWVCPYRITGFGEPQVRGMFGVDAMQALVLTLHSLPAELRASARDTGGSIAESDLGLDHACRTHLGLDE